MHLIFGAHPETKSLLAIKLFSQVTTVRILTRILQMMPVKHGLPMKSII